MPSSINLVRMFFKIRTSVPRGILRIVGHGSGDAREFTAHRRDHHVTHTKVRSTVQRVDPPVGLLGSKERGKDQNYAQG
jgi:hypothetical protein